LLTIEGMTCKECASHVQTALSRVPGVAEARVDYDKQEALVCSRPGADVKAELLVQAVRKAGYRATLKR
jgi:copper chaperone CopZ